MSSRLLTSRPLLLNKDATPYHIDTAWLQKEKEGEEKESSRPRNATGNVTYEKEIGKREREDGQSEDGVHSGNQPGVASHHACQCCQILTRTLLNVCLEAAAEGRTAVSPRCRFRKVPVASYSACRFSCLSPFVHSAIPRNVLQIQAALGCAFWGGIWIKWRHQLTGLTDYMDPIALR